MTTLPQLYERALSWLPWLGGGAGLLLLGQLWLAWRFRRLCDDVRALRVHLTKQRERKGGG